jgi:hypothetical protein
MAGILSKAGLLTRFIASGPFPKSKKLPVVLAVAPHHSGGSVREFHPVPFSPASGHLGELNIQLGGILYGEREFVNRKFSAMIGKK